MISDKVQATRVQCQTYEVDRQWSEGEEEDEGGKWPISS